MVRGFRAAEPRRSSLLTPHSSLAIAMELKGRQALVLGLGVSGLSMARWLARRGARVRVADTRSAPPCAAQLERELPAVRIATGPLREDSFTGVDLVAVSPGISAKEPPIAAAAARGVPVVGDVELFAQALPHLGGSKVLAITGSNGKSTVTEMTGAMCRAAGLKTVVAGNIGLPVLDALLEIERTPAPGASFPDAFVLELSSFQLENTYSLDAHAAVCLNLSEDHLDRYAGMHDYARAKARIFRGTGVQVLNRQDPMCFSMAHAGTPRRHLRSGRAAREARLGAAARRRGSLARTRRSQAHAGVGAARGRAAQRCQRTGRGCARARHRPAVRTSAAGAGGVRRLASPRAEGRRDRRRELLRRLEGHQRGCDGCCAQRHAPARRADRRRRRQGSGFLAAQSRRSPGTRARWC